MTLRVLVTGFGKFPGARDNPTALLVHALGGHRARLARLGVELETDVLPVNYAEVARKLEELDETLKPDAILHFGLAARRKFFSIETRALNRLSLVHCDASGARAGRLAIIARATCRALYHSLSPNRSHISSRGPPKPLVGQCRRLCLQRIALSFARTLPRPRDRLHSCAAARARQSAEEGIARQPP